MIIKMMETVEINTPKFHRGPSSFQTLMKKISCISDWINARIKITDAAKLLSKEKASG